MANIISDSEANRLGVFTKHEIMDNGELRFRLSFNDGSSYIRTEAPSFGVWQNSHYHSTLQEMYIIQEGWIIFVEYDKVKRLATFKLVNKGQFCTSTQGVPHNVFVSSKTKFHTVKFGNLSLNDWIEFKDLDALTRHLSQKDAIKMCEEKTNNKLHKYFIKALNE